MQEPPPISVPMLKPNANRVFLPRGLRDAIPEQHHGRDLALESITAAASNHLFYGPQVQLKLSVKETGKLTGQFALTISIEPAAARALARNLADLAD